MSTTTHAIHNFSAGPCILPPSVLRQASEAVNDLDGSGLSLIEISHRSKPFVAIMEEARQLVRTELALPDHYEVLFLQGGASLGFLTAAMNFLPESGSMDYTVTGTWAKKALKEAQRVGQAKALTSSEESGFDRVPPLPGHTDADRRGATIGINFGDSTDDRVDHSVRSAGDRCGPLGFGLHDAVINKDRHRFCST